MKATYYPIGADLVLRVSLSDVEGSPLDLSACKWSLSLGTGTGGSVELLYDGNSCSSLGEIEASCETGLGFIRVFAKSSVVNFGLGVLLMRIDLSIPSDKFSDGWQKLVFKSMRCVGGGRYEINTKITIVE